MVEDLLFVAFFLGLDDLLNAPTVGLSFSRVFTERLPFGTLTIRPFLPFEFVARLFD